jgi:hypothetical protein
MKIAYIAWRAKKNKGYFDIKQMASFTFW